MQRCPISVAGASVEPVSAVRDLGVFIDSDLGAATHVRTSLRLSPSISTFRQTAKNILVSPVISWHHCLTLSYPTTLPWTSIYSYCYLGHVKNKLIDVGSKYRIACCKYLTVLYDMIVLPVMKAASWVQLVKHSKWLQTSLLYCDMGTVKIPIRTYRPTLRKVSLPTEIVASASAEPLTVSNMQRIMVGLMFKLKLWLSQPVRLVLSPCSVVVVYTIIVSRAPPLSTQ